MKKIYVIVIAIIIVGTVSYLVAKESSTQKRTAINSFEDCIQQYGIVLESYPRQCRTKEGKTFVENIGNSLDKIDLVKVTNIVPNQEIVSPLVVEGFARGYWFFEASFPIIVIDADGTVVGEGFATTDEEWMTTDFISFTATVSYDESLISDDSRKGTLVLQRANASGLPENDDALELPVTFQ